MRYTHEQKSKAVTDVVGFYDSIYNILMDLLDRVDDADIGCSDPCWLAIDAINDGLIYTDDIWEIMRYYQTPEEANEPQAIECLTNDLASIIEKLAELNEMAG